MPHNKKATSGLKQNQDVFFIRQEMKFLKFYLLSTVLKMLVSTTAAKLLIQENQYSSYTSEEPVF